MKTLRSISTPVGLAQKEKLLFLFKDAVVYGIVTVLSRSFSLLTFPLLARYFTVSEYGTIDLFLVLLSFLVTFIVFGQDSAVARYFYEYEDEKLRRELITQSLLTQIVLCMIIVLGLGVTIPIFASWISPAPNSEILLKIILFQAPFAVAINFSQNILKWTFQRNRFLIMSLGFSAIQALMLVSVTSFGMWGLSNVLASYAAVNVIFGALGLLLVRHWLTWPRLPDLSKKLIKFAIPVGIICTIGAIVPFLERNFILLLLGDEQLGLYSAGSKVAMLMALLVGTFQTAWGPFSTSIHRQADAPSTFNLVLKLFGLCVCLLTLLLDVIATPLLTMLASNRYIGGAIVVFPLAFALAIQAVGWITEIGIGLGKQSTLYLVSYTAFLGTFLLFVWVLAPYMGISGIAAALVTAHAVRAFVSSWLAQKSFHYPWEYSTVINMLLCTLAAGLLASSDLFELGSFSKIINHLFFATVLITYCARSIYHSHQGLIISIFSQLMRRLP